jgi:hypothetical protein
VNYVKSRVRGVEGGMIGFRAYVRATRIEISNAYDMKITLERGRGTLCPVRAILAILTSVEGHLSSSIFLHGKC